MIFRSILLSTLAVLALSACGSRDDGKDKDGVVAINADSKTGKVDVKLPGFSANLNLPKIMLDHSNFDLDGVKLYPGSKVRGVVVNAGEGDKAKVRVSFESPADQGKVKDWFKSAFGEHEVAFSETQTGFSGKTNDGDAFVLTLTPKGEAATSGTIDIDG
ncbi:hypothetical protein [Aquisediminimonas profunda]|uniref:hypothetical protein n=1 Tax=Aquisediminimonas profunda TaxID=1550733 RepID=UPI001C627FEA|nr:hypothetical protein [Aquisediminimonas profunda]